MRSISQDFAGGVARMRFFVGRLHVHEDHVVIVQSREGAGHLALVVVVGLVGHSRDVEDGHSRLHGESAQEVDPGSQRGGTSVERGEGGHAPGPHARPEEPDLRRRRKPPGDPLLIDGMSGQDLLRPLHERQRQRCARSLRNSIGDRSVAGVVRGGEAGGQEVGAFLDGQDLAKTHAGMETHPLVAQLLLQGLDQHCGLLGGDVPRGVTRHGAVSHRHQAAAHGHLTGLQLDTHGHGLDGTASGVVESGIESQKTHAGDRARGLHPLRHGVGQPERALAGKEVEIGQTRGLQGSAPGEGLDAATQMLRP